MSDVAFHEKGFSNVFLEECLICFKMCGDGKKYIYVCVCMCVCVCVCVCVYFVIYGV